MPASVARNEGPRDLVGTYRGRRCFVTGHTGFKGSWLCVVLHTLGAKVTGYSLDPPTTPSLFDRARIKHLLEDIRADVRDCQCLSKAIDRSSPEIVFHLAAQPIVRLSYELPRETFETNVGGTTNLLEAVRGCPSARAVVVITSDKCYENREWVHGYRETDRLGGDDPYSASKAAAEIVCGAYEHAFFGPAGVGLGTCRAGNVIGGGDWALDRIIPDAVRALEEGRPVPIRNPSSVRPWQHVLEPLYGYLLLGSKLVEDPSYSGAWNFGPLPESCRTVKELVECFLSAWGSGRWEDLSAEQGSSPREARSLLLAWDKAFHLLGWRPRWDFEEAVRRTGNWYRRLAGGAEAAQLCAEEIRAYLEPS